jgi:polysaccharide biosynthesis/export protein
MTNSLRALFSLTLPLLVCGCSSYLPAPIDDEPPEFVLRLGPGDRLDISVYGEEELQDEVTVGPDGNVSFPLIGELELGGFTLNEARVELANQLKATVMRDFPDVSVRLVELRSAVIHVTGEVTRPGSLPFVRGASVLGVVQAAGGPRWDTAELSEVIVIRDRLGDQRAYAIDLTEVLAGQRRDMWLIPGDTVYVPARTLTRWDRWTRQALPWSEPLPVPQRD